VERGSTSRGKYTFFIKWALPTTLWTDVITLLEKKFQGRRAQRTKTGKRSIVLFGNMMVKTTVKMTIIIRGFRRDQRKPKTEFL